MLETQHQRSPERGHEARRELHAPPTHVHRPALEGEERWRAATNVHYPLDGDTSHPQYSSIVIVLHVLKSLRAALLG
jgi:hypothetical protein